MADTNSWSCSCSASIISQDDKTATIEVICYWQSNGYAFNQSQLSGITAYVYARAKEVCVKNNGSYNSMTANGKYEMGRATYKIDKGTIVDSIECYARIIKTGVGSGNKNSSTSTIKVNPKKSYTVSYNANGGSSTPSNQTKWIDTPITLANAITRTGYKFVGWGKTKDTKTYNAGASYNENSSVTLYAVWEPNTYTVTYSKGTYSSATNLPSNQTKTHDKNLTLSNTRPALQYYNFLYWKDNNGKIYYPGSVYSGNAAVTLTAVFEQYYEPPRITAFKVERCLNDGTIKDSGTQVKVTVSYQADNYSNTGVNIDVLWNVSNSSVKLNHKHRILSANKKASDTVSYTIKTDVFNNFSANSSYEFVVIVYDETDKTQSTVAVLNSQLFPIDIRKGGKGVAIGGVAETNDLFDVYFNTKFRKELTVGGATTLHNLTINSGNTVNFSNAKTFSVPSGWTAPVATKWGDLINNRSVENNEDTWIPVFRDNYMEHVQKVKKTSKTHSNHGISDDYRLATMSCFNYWNGAYNSSNNSNLTYCYQGTIQAKGTVLYNSTGATGTITLSQSAANFDRIDITYIVDGNHDYLFGVTIYQPNNQNVALFGSIGWKDSSLNAYYANLSARMVRVSNTSISNASLSGYSDTKCQVLFHNKTTAVDNDQKDIIRIKKVVGYK